MKVTLLLIASLLLASSALTSSARPIPTCKAITKAQINTAIHCQLSNERCRRFSSNLNELSSVFFSLHLRVFNRPHKEFAFTSAGKVTEFINNFNDHAAQTFGCVDGKKSTFYTSFQKYYEIIGSKKIKKKYSRTFSRIEEKINLYNTCTRPLMEVSSHATSTGVSTVTFVNSQIEQYNADTKGEFKWGVDADAHAKWSKDLAKKIRTAITGKNSIQSSLKQILKTKYYGRKTCGNKFRAVLSTFDSCWTGKDSSTGKSDITKTRSYQFLNFLGRIANGLTTSADGTSWFNDKSKYERFLQLTKRAFINLEKCASEEGQSDLIELS